MQQARQSKTGGVKLVDRVVKELPLLANVTVTTLRMELAPGESAAEHSGKQYGIEAVAPGAMGPGNSRGTTATLNQFGDDPAGRGGGVMFPGKCASRKSAIPLRVADWLPVFLMVIVPHTCCPLTDAVLLTLMLAPAAAARAPADLLAPSSRPR
jgi:hypothetical protein